MSLHISVFTTAFICLAITVTSSYSADGKGDILQLRKDSLSDQTFFIGHMKVVIFNCSVEGSPKPMITWKRNGYPIENDDQYNITEEGDLIIKEPNITNDGDVVMCIGSNSVGHIMSDNATLIIAYIDAFPASRPFVEIEVQRLLGVCLPCNPPRAYPGILTIWSKPGTRESVNEDERKAIMTDGRLCFAFVQPSDTGLYLCSVANSFDNAGELTVAYNSNPNDIRLTVTDNHGDPAQSLARVSGLNDNNVIVKKGQTATLDCFFHGKPSPDIIWMKGQSKIQTHTNSKMVILNAQPENSGEYRCVGSSESNSEEITYNLIVTSPPILTTELESDMKVYKHSNVSLRCETNDADDTYEWFYNAEPFISTERMQLQDGNTLFIKRALLRDSGIYQCQVQNQHGFSLSSTQLEVDPKDKPMQAASVAPDNLIEERPKQAASGDGIASKAKLHGGASVSLLMAMTLTSVIHRLI